MTVILSGADCVASILITSLCAVAEKASPPYFFGIMSPKNFFSFKKDQISFGISLFSKICQSFVISHRSCNGPWIKFFSSLVNVGSGFSNNFFKFGFPENSSPSIQIVPDSMATFSVLDIVGKNWSALSALSMGKARIYFLMDLILNKMIRALIVSVQVSGQANANKVMNKVENIHSFVLV